jgi:uncharacterized protein with NRDE domain
MCILGILLRMNTRYPFIFIDNRDEFLDRPTEPGISLNAQTHIICARDLKEGGTWCGCNTESGLFSVLTNVEELGVSKENKRSRGEVIDRLLQMHIEKEEDWINILKDKNWISNYAGFNVVIGNIFNICSDNTSQVYYMTNRKYIEENRAVPYDKFEEIKVHSFKKGILSLSNSFMNDETWSKVKYLRDQMKETLNKIVTEYPDASVIQIRDELGKLLLTHSEQVELPQQKNVSDSLFEEKRERMLLETEIRNNVFVHIESEGVVYKTRAQTIIIGEQNGTVHYFYRNTDRIVNPLLPLSAPWDYVHFHPKSF